MKRFIFWSCLLASLGLIVFKTNLLTDIFVLCVMGMVPGTEVRVPPVALLTLYPIGVLGAVYWLIKQPMFFGSHARNEATARELARKRVRKVSRKSHTTSPRQTRRRYRHVNV